MKNHLVSVLICTYNAEKTIESTLLSCLNQTYKEFEILILDNGSNDRTREIIQEMQKDYKSIKLFYEGKNLGAYDGLNYLIDKSNGEFIAIQDHDDIWHQEKLEYQVKFLERNQYYTGCGTGTLIYYGISKIGYLHSLTAGPTDLVMHTSIMFRNNGFKYNTKDTFMCDSLFMKKTLSMNKKRLWVIPEILSLHYIKETGDNLSAYWFTPKLKNLRRYFEVYGLSLYYFFIFIYLLIMWMIRPFPKRLRKNIDRFLIIYLKGAKSKNYLIKYNNNNKDLISLID